MSFLFITKILGKRNIEDYFLPYLFIIKLSLNHDLDNILSKKSRQIIFIFRQWKNKNDSSDLKK